MEHFMPKPLWILVANASVARCFERASPNASLVLVANYQHPESRSHVRDLQTDRGGRTQKDDAGRTSFVPRTEPKERERAEFAREIARALEAGVVEHRCSGIALFASSPFLGELQANLTDGARKLVHASHALDLTSFEGRELEQRVTRALTA
jgi:protein required for attachment to host cells